VNRSEKEEMFVVSGLAGQKKLSGSVAISGSKNAALPALAASILFKNPTTYELLPNIEDIKRVYELLQKLGADVHKESGSVRITTTDVINGKLYIDIAKRMRASILFTGPLLARFGEVVFPHPGGCVIGERPIDLFLESFVRMGADVADENDIFSVTAPNGLSGAELFLPVQSVTATETLMMTAVLATGATTIHNAAMEPEVTHLADFLKTAGADITGEGTSTITIIGRNGLLFDKTVTYKTPPDRLEAGSFLILGALCAQELKITNCIPDELNALIERLRRAGVSVDVDGENITVRSPKQIRAVSVKTHEYPGFPTDLQAPMVVFLSQADGESRVFETIFEGRLHYIQDLERMGADIRLISDREILIHGPKLLHDKELKSPDIRAGLAFIIAAAIAEGTSKIYDIYAIDRGYENIEEKLESIGLDIKRVAR